MADPTDRFFLDTSNYLSYDYESYRNSMYALSLSQPSRYFEIRKQVLEQVRNDYIKNIYTVFYNLLALGKDKDGNDLPGLTDPRPGYPKQLVSQYSLKCARTVEQMLAGALEIILPVDFKDLATKRLQDQSKENF